MKSTSIQVPTIRRYLVPFDPKRVPHLFTDVLVIGGGIAGIRAALAVDPALRTVVVATHGVHLCMCIARLTVVRFCCSLLRT